MSCLILDAPKFHDSNKKTLSHYTSLGATLTLIYKCKHCDHRETSSCPVDSIDGIARFGYSVERRMQKHIEDKHADKLKVE